MPLPKPVNSLLTELVININNILEFSFDQKINQSSNILVIFDTLVPLAKLIYEGYLKSLNSWDGADFIDFYSVLDKDRKNYFLKTFEKLNKDDMVIMIQSSNFRLDDFRIRLHLFEKGIKVLEHMHLYRNSESSYPSYIKSLAYSDKERSWYKGQKIKIENAITKSQSKTLEVGLKISSNATELILSGPLENPKANIGNYTGLTNQGGTYPIGEVFTEAQNLENLNGKILIYAFANKNFEVEFSKPFEATILNGELVNVDDKAPDSFKEVLEMVKACETTLIREIGFGLNKGLDPLYPLGDITAFERIEGIHLSMGHKHSVYKKPSIKAHKARFHIDIFILANEATIGDVQIIKNNRYC